MGVRLTAPQTELVKDSPLQEMLGDSLAEHEVQETGTREEEVDKDVLEQA